MKLLFITNLCMHYRVKTYETLARRVPTQFLFFSQGGERYYNSQFHGKSSGAFPHEYLSGWSIGGVDVAPALPRRILLTDADVVLKCIVGRFALPASYLAARLKGIPFVLYTGVWADLTTPFHRWTYALNRHIHRHADAVVVYGEHVRRYVLGMGVQPERVFIAAHGLDNSIYDRPVSWAEREELRSRLGLERRKVVLFVGRFEPAKGLGYLAQAAAMLGRRDLTLLFVGDGAERASLEAACRAAGGDARFAGTVPTNELYRFHNLADLFVLPSVTTPYGREPWGLVVNEAMNQGVPVIASDAVGAAAGGLVRHCDTGLVVPERDAPALAEAIRMLLDDPELARRLGAAGRREVALWTNERMADGFIAAAEYALKVHGNSHR